MSATEHEGANGNASGASDDDASTASDGDASTASDGDASSVPTDDDPSLARRTLLRATDWFRGGSAADATAGDEHGAFLSRSRDGRDYRLYVPTGYDPADSAPLVVMLHGCRQTPSSFAAATGMNAVAEDEGFLVAYPKQSLLANPMRCWRWYDDAQTARGGGELAAIAAATRAVTDEFAVDPGRIYVAGLSAGGAMALRAAVAYPDIYAACAVHSGLAYGVADGALSAMSRMRSAPTPRQRPGAAVRRAMGERARPLPCLVVHGTADDVVDVGHGRQVTRQLVGANDLDERVRGDGRASRSSTADSGAAGGSADTVERGSTAAPDGVETGSTGRYEYTRRRFRDALGRPLVEEWLVEGMGHGWAGGRPDAGYTAPGGPDASRLAWDFFDRFERSALEPAEPLTVRFPVVGTRSVPRLRRLLARVRRRLQALRNRVGRD